MKQTQDIEGIEQHKLELYIKVLTDCDREDTITIIETIFMRGRNHQLEIDNNMLKKDLDILTNKFN